MRKVKEMQMKLGEVNIADIEFDLRSRDEIPQFLLGLQHIWCRPVKIIMGAYDNIKVTTPEDFIVAEALLKKRNG